MLYIIFFCGSVCAFRVFCLFLLLVFYFRLCTAKFVLSGSCGMKIDEFAGGIKCAISFMFLTFPITAEVKRIPNISAINQIKVIAFQLIDTAQIQMRHCVDSFGVMIFRMEFSLCPTIESIYWFLSSLIVTFIQVSVFFETISKLKAGSLFCWLMLMSFVFSIHW